MSFFFCSKNVHAHFDEDEYRQINFLCRTNRYIYNVQQICNIYFLVQYLILHWAFCSRTEMINWLNWKKKNEKRKCSMPKTYYVWPNIIWSDFVFIELQQDPKNHVLEEGQACVWSRLLFSDIFYITIFIFAFIQCFLFECEVYKLDIYVCRLKH